MASDMNATGLALFILCSLLTSTIFPSLPDLLLRSIILSGAVLLLLGLLKFKRWGDETKYIPRFVVCFSLAMAELSIENCMVWLVSATDKRKYDNVPGLQDNLRLAIEMTYPTYPLLYRLAAARLADALTFLVALLALAFSVLWDQVPYSGFGIMSRVMATMAASRSLRVACFMSTVLPNPHPGCYQLRFPPVPDTVWETVMAGYTTIRGFGGCNDLLFSGHAAFWVLAPLAHFTYYRTRSKGSKGHSLIKASNSLLWAFLVQACLHDVVGGHHYSVDMILAVVVTWACWSWLHWVYDPVSEKLSPRNNLAPADARNPLAFMLIAVGLVAAGVIVIGGRA
ncbi:hypothetical protein CEUSTIGMA_g12472.t1 [Chlamydomonas eustigma]|uniref:Sphingomyelin synthase-like domain-containing protein n=1 Tax=Chlamydomonas eustigma TaxID=1157962 RepID=A0A250XQ45_9CHLO|nr:hypothetical protein CEUSTIGMA_g12472.t1 [Chlamydomonas eustigma]|eukprot:GAX85052.1 hypothetical protein CEUSTIGMA_g12472.t1 [Chlamydomonas eustigma]